MERELWIAEKMSEYRRLPLESHTIMFIESYSHGLGGVVSYLFRKAINDPQYKDYQLIWTVRDYEAALDEFGDLLSDKRVKIVKTEMPDFLRSLAVSGIIICGNPLPNYFLKRIDQKIYTHMALGSLMMQSYSRYQVRNLVKTINDTDKFICLDEYDKNILLKNYRIKPERIHHINIEDVFNGKEKNSRVVVISINGLKNITESCATFAAFVKRVKAVLSYYDLEIKVFVGYDFWKKYRSQKENIGIEEIYSADQDMSGSMNGAALFITDTVYRAAIAQRLNVPTIILNRVNIPSVFSYIFDDVQYAIGWASLYHSFECKFGGLGPDGGFLYDEHTGLFEMPFSKEFDIDSEYDTDSDDSDNSEADKKPDEDDNRKEIEEKTGEEDEELENDDDDVETDLLKGSLTPDTRSYHIEIKKILYVFRWEPEEGYLESIMRWLDEYDRGDQEITVLFLNSGNQVLYSHVSELALPHLITLRAGFYQSTAEERQMMTDKSPELDSYLEEKSHVFIDEEWKRMLGNVRFDKVYAENTTNYFWNRMYKYAPTDDFILLMSKADKDKIFNSVNENVEEQ